MMHRIFKNIRALNGPQGDERRSNFWRISRRVMWDVALMYLVPFFVGLIFLLMFLVIAMGFAYLQHPYGGILYGWLEGLGAPEKDWRNNWEMAIFYAGSFVIIVCVLVRISRNPPLPYMIYIGLIAALPVLLAGIVNMVGLFAGILSVKDAALNVGAGGVANSQAALIAILWRWRISQQEYRKD